jgi:hypothetical protein
VVASELLGRQETVAIIVRDSARGREWMQQGADLAVGSLDDRAFVAGVVRDAAGFPKVTIEDRTMTFECSSVDAYLQIVFGVAGWTRRLQALSPGDFSRLRESVMNAAQQFCVDGRVQVESAVNCAAGRK